MHAAHLALPFALALCLPSSAQAKYERLRQSFPFLPTTNTLVDVADVTGDGFADVVRASPSQFVAFRNNGWGVFGSEVRTPNPIALSQDYSIFELVDIDLDGFLDAVTATYTGFYAPGYAANRIFRGDGQGGFTFSSEWSVAASVTHLLFADLSGDGAPDRITASFRDFSYEDIYQVAFNDGPGTTSFTEVESIEPFNNINSLAVADVDSNGWLDVLLGRPGPNNLRLNQGAGVFVDSSAALSAYSEPTRDIAAADVDGDGDTDLFFANLGSTDRLLRNDGPNVFNDITDAVTGDTATSSKPKFADLDADGDLDLIHYRTPAPGEVFVRQLENDGLGGYQEAASIVAAGISGDLQLIDLDGDMDLDLVISKRDPRIYYNDGLGNLRDSTSPYALLTGGPTNDVLADFNGDSYPDAAFEGRVLLNDTTGKFAELTDIPAIDGSFRTVALDLEGNGAPDLYFSSGHLLRNQFATGGGFTDESGQLPASLTSGPDPFTLIAADFTGDDADELLTWSGFLDLEYYANDGAGTLTETAAGLGLASSSDAPLQAGDLDGDADNDLVFRQGLWRNDGAGSFVSIPTPTDFEALLAGDLDGSGSMDVVGVQGVFLNDGSGAFSSLPKSLPNPFGFLWDLDDVDRDGDLDLLAQSLSGFPPDLSVYWNDGQAAFEEGPLVLVGFSGNYRFADLDIDGDLDVVESLSFTTVTTNVVRQLVRGNIPRLGKPFDLRVYGEPGDAFFVAFSFSSVLVPTAVGNLRVDPGGLIPLGSGSLDAKGRSTLAFVLPAHPSLAGLTLMSQAFVGDRLTAGEWIPLTTF